MDITRSWDNLMVLKCKDGLQSCFFFKYYPNLEWLLNEANGKGGLYYTQKKSHLPSGCHLLEASQGGNNCCHTQLVGYPEGCEGSWWEKTFLVWNTQMDGSLPNGWLSELSNSQKLPWGAQPLLKRSLTIGIPQNWN